MSMPEDEAVAIVGYGGVFPGAGDPEGLWANIVEAVDATTEVPPGAGCSLRLRRSTPGSPSRTRFMPRAEASSARSRSTSRG